MGRRTPDRAAARPRPGRPEKRAEWLPHGLSLAQFGPAPAAVLRGLLRAKVESYLPARALEIARVAEQSEQAGLRLLAGNVQALGLEEANEILWKG